MSDYSYHSYLLQGSFFGNIYRKCLLYPWLLRLLGSHDFLDVGCGVGMFLSQGSPNSIGIDVNPYNIKYINSHMRQKAYCICSREPVFPFADSCFSTIVCDQVLEHIIDPIPLLSEINRVSSSKSKLLIGLPLRKGYLADPDHKTFYTLRSAVELISASTDFRPQKHFAFPLPLFFFGNLFTWQYMYILFSKVCK